MPTRTRSMKLSNDADNDNNSNNNNNDNIKIKNEMNSDDKASSVVPDEKSVEIKTEIQETPETKSTKMPKKRKATTAKSTQKPRKPRKNKAPSKAVTPSPSTPKSNSSNTPTTPSTPSSTSSTSSKSSSARKRIRVRIEPHSLPLPQNFTKTYKLVEELRQDKNAPVDSDGPTALAETKHGDKVFRFQVLIALMLSSQTKDEVVGQAIRNLQTHGLNAHNIHSNTTPDQLNKFIQKVGFHNNKTKYIKQACEIMVEQYNGDIPPTADEMMKLPGVGPKMAYIIESIAFNTTTGIGVDTHMHRMFNQLKWVNSTTPEKTREQLEGFLPKEYWGSINYLFVGLGQQVQQQKDIVLRKAIQSTNPKETFGLLKKLGFDWRKESKKYGLEEEVKAAMDRNSD